MKVIIMGCGKVGTLVSRRMAEEGHEVIVIDADQSARDRLGPHFKGRLVVGIGFDRQVLLDAGIEQAEAFAATSTSDSTNIVAARIARNIYRVPRVVCRLYDPRRAEIYNRLGLVTISSTTWGAERIYELMTHGDLDAVMTFGQGQVSLVAVEAPAQLVGRTVSNLAVPGEVIVVSITRQGEAIVPVLGTAFKQGDLVHLAVHAAAMTRLESLLGMGEGG
jgi:trk system potassium uptake protein TrkA